MKQSAERIKKKEDFVKKYNLKGDGNIPKIVIEAARTEIGYSKNTISMDIGCSINSFAKSLTEKKI